MTIKEVCPTTAAAGARIRDRNVSFAGKRGAVVPYGRYIKGQAILNL